MMMAFDAFARSRSSPARCCFVSSRCSRAMEIATAASRYRQRQGRGRGLSCRARIARPVKSGPALGARCLRDVDQSAG